MAVNPAREISCTLPEGSTWLDAMRRIHFGNSTAILAATPYNSGIAFSASAWMSSSEHP
jgi:hypothetical protein